MKISFEAYEATRSRLPLAPVNTRAAAVKSSRRIALGFKPQPVETALFHAWRP